MAITFDELDNAAIELSKSVVLVNLKGRLIERTLTLGLNPSTYNYATHTVTASEGTEDFYNQTMIAQLAARIAYVEAYAK